MKNYLPEIAIIALKNNGICLSSACTTVKSRVKVKCIDKHIWKTDLDHLRQGHWCRICNNKKYTIDDGIRLAEQRNGKCLAKTHYIGINDIILWECKEKHQWRSKFKNILYSNSWCPKCKYQNSKLTLEEAQNLAIQNGGKCLSDIYINAKTKMLWECSKLHQWNAEIARIKNGQWCPKCNIESQRSGLKMAQKLAKKHGGKCLSNKYTNAHTKMLWECKEKHQWKTTYACVRDGQWCSYCCNKVWKTQKQIFDIICLLLNTNNVMYNYHEFDWLRNDKTGSKLEIDIWVPYLKLAIEYDGEQHFMPVSFGGISLDRAKKKLKSTKYNDKLKNKLIKEHPDEIQYFIRFNYKHKITEEYVKKQLIKHGVPI